MAKRFILDKKVLARAVVDVPTGQLRHGPLPRSAQRKRLPAVPATAMVIAVDGSIVAFGPAVHTSRAQEPACS